MGLFDDVRAGMDVAAAAQSSLRVRDLVATRPHTPHASALVRSWDAYYASEGDGPQGGGETGVVLTPIAQSDIEGWDDMALCDGCGAMGLYLAVHVECPAQFGGTFIDMVVPR